MSRPEAGVTYPREVGVLPGMPPGWKGIEKEYGPASRAAGQVYCRYFSLNGKHRNICTPKQVITLHCEEKGTDPEPMLQEYARLQFERKQQQMEERKVEREAKGKLTGSQREERVERFRDRFGMLSGPVVFWFKGWKTRWHYQPNCDQVMVEYIDTEGGSWKLLKDLECAFQLKIERGEGAHLPQLIEDAKVHADPAEFAQGSKMARECGGVYEMSPESGDTKVISQEERIRIADEKAAARSEAKQAPIKKARYGQVSLSPEPPQKAVMPAFSSKEEVLQAFPRFRNFLKLRGFKGTCELVAVFGVAPERVYSRQVSGFYYQLPEPFEEDRCYQKLLHFPKARDEVGCDGIYIVRSGELNRWEITTHLRTVRPVVAHSGQAVVGIPLLKAKGPWQIQDGSGDFMEDAGLSVILDPGVSGG